MTPAQATDIFTRLCAAYRQKVEDAEIKLWLEHLLPLPYDQADEAASAMIRSPKYKFMPRIGEFVGFVDELHNQGVPNALGGAQVQAKVEPFGIWRQDQIVAMSEEDYWRYLYEDEFRSECERRWQDQWAHMPDKPYQHREVRAGDGAR